MPKALFICGSMNQTTMMHKISKQFKSYECYFTPYYDDGVIGYLAEKGLLEFTILGNKLKRRAENYLVENRLNIDPENRIGDYDIVFTCSDLSIPNNIRNDRIILIQEGMIDPENLMYYLLKSLGLPRYLTSTSTTDLSDAYELFFVVSEGYTNNFIRKGVKVEKIVVSGIPNYDYVAKLLENDFPHKNYVFAMTSDSWATLKNENRYKLIRHALKIADGRQLIFKVPPNEKVERATYEIKSICPDALVYSEGNIGYMIANCDVLITKYSSVVNIGIALGKEVYSYFDVDYLEEMTPIKNAGKSTELVAKKCHKSISSSSPSFYPNNIVMDF